jgi:hypothetical protein
MATDLRTMMRDAGTRNSSAATFTASSGVVVSQFEIFSGDDRRSYIHHRMARDPPPPVKYLTVAGTIATEAGGPGRRISVAWRRHGGFSGLRQGCANPGKSPVTVLIHINQRLL